MATRKRKDNSTVFDDVYRTIVQKLPQLLIALINEIFGTDYPEDVEKAQLRNEQFVVHKKLITDSILRIQGKRYHVECQSTPDGAMVLRMFEYGAAIALEEAREQESEPLVIRFPLAAVLYLRSDKEKKPELAATVEFPDGQRTTYRVPVLHLSDYTLDRIFEKRLLLLLPYYILRYEKELKDLAPDSEEAFTLLSEYQTLAARLNAYLIQEKHPELYWDITKLIVRVADYILQNNEEIQKGVDDIMGGRVLELYSEKLMRRGEKKGSLDTLRSLVQKGILTISQAAQELGVSEEKFRKMATL